jgi:protein-S-isoprenylcysteine O-methyltransferase Ste14
MRRYLVPGLFLAVAAFTAVHAQHATASAVARPSSHNLLLALYAILRTGVVLAFALFTVNRAEPRRHCREPAAIVACAVAVLATVIVAVPGRTASSPLLIAGDAVAVCGCVWLLGSVLVLGRCFGVLPEARGLVVRGPYRLVRHPVYLGEIVALGGLMLAAPTVRNLPVLVMLVVAQVVRAQFEEQALTEAFPEYEQYARRTPVLVPRIRFRRSPAPACARP